MATTSGTLSAAGSVALTLTSGPVPDNRALVSVSGTYGTAVFKLQGTPDGSNWYDLAAQNVSTLSWNTSSLTPTDNSNTAYAVDVTGCSQVRLSLSSLASGTLAVHIATAYAPFSPNQTPSNAGSTIGSLTTNDITAGDSSLGITGVAGSGTGNGGVVAVVGGTSGSGATGNGGAVSYTGGAASSTNGNGGAASLVGGVATGTGTGGAVTITSGASAGASGTVGAVTIDAGSAAGGTGAAVSIAPTNATGVSIGKTITLADAVNIVTNATTGTKIGTATTQKIGFWNATPVVQQATTGTLTGFTAGSGTAVNDDSTFTGNSGTAAYTIGDIVLALKNLGILAAS